MSDMYSVSLQLVRFEGWRKAGGREGRRQEVKEIERQIDGERETQRERENTHTTYYM